MHVSHLGRPLTAIAASFEHSQTLNRNRFATSRTPRPPQSCRGAVREGPASRTGSLCRTSQLGASVRFPARRRGYSRAVEACSVPRFAATGLNQLQASSASCSTGR